MKESFIIVKRHGSKKYEVIRGPKDSRTAHRTFLKQFRGKHRHAEFAEVYPVKPTGRFRLDPDRAKRPEPAKPGLIQRAITAITGTPASPAAPEAKPAESEAKKPANRAQRRAATQKPKSAGAFAERVAAAQAAQN